MERGQGITYEQAVARALLSARKAWTAPDWWLSVFHTDGDAMAYAWRRLRVMAGVGP